MRRVSGTLAAVAICAALWPTVSHAIVWGEPDGDAHPNVGELFLKFDPDEFSFPHPGVPPGIRPLCSGSVVAKDGNRALFLTAGHCVTAVLDLLQIFASLDPEVIVAFSGNHHEDLGVTIPVNTDVPYFLFEGIIPGFMDDAVDIGILVLEAEQEANLPEPVTLPQAGLLDSLGPAGLHRSEIRVVGFGTDITEPTPHTISLDFLWGIREIAYPRPVNLSEQWLMAQQHGPSGSSGVYFGDSGGPLFRVDPDTGEETLVAIVGWGVGTEFTSTVAQHFRIDTALSLEFIDAVKDEENFEP